MLTHRKVILIIFVSALVVTVLIHVSTVLMWVENLRTPGLPEIERGGIIHRLKMEGIDGIIQVLLFLIMALFNYRLKDRLIPKSIGKGRVWYIVLLNLIVLFIFIRLDLLIREITGLGYSLTVFSKISLEHGISRFSLLSLLLYTLKYLPVLFVSLFLTYLLLQIQQNRAAEARLVQIKEEKVKAELSALKDQISPHFFFNTLSSLSAVVRNGPKKEGLEFIREMSNTYRYTLTSRQHDLVALSEEMEFLKAYTFLLKKRFESGFHVEINIPEELLKTGKIPPMSLQLLVENGIQHNVITGESPIIFTVYVEEDMICIRNTLNRKENSEGFGSGLKNLANRFSLIAAKDIVIQQDESYFTVKLPLL
jgi:sensor histidine kinase YesM